MPARLMLFAWHGNDMWWAKSTTCGVYHPWTALYQHLADGARQVIVHCDAVLEHCIVPPVCEPIAALEVELNFLRPIILYACAMHGLGLVAVSKDASRMMRNGIWQLKPECMNPSLAPFAAGLFKTRCGGTREFEYESLIPAIRDQGH